MFPNGEAALLWFENQVLNTSAKKLRNLAGVQLVKLRSLDQKIKAQTKLSHNPSTTLRMIRFIKEHADPNAVVYADDSRSFSGLAFIHKPVNQC